MTERLYSVEDAAAALGISPLTLGDWLRAGKIVGTKIGRKWRITESDLQAFIVAGRRANRCAGTNQT
jgi:excisionase family DNA binding protein